MTDDAVAPSPDPQHEPVLARAVLELLEPRSGGTYVDGTLGFGGHAARVLAASAPHGRLVGIDRDAESLAHARRRLGPWEDRVVLIHADYRQGPAILASRGITSYDGVLLDLGLSSMHLSESERGFSLAVPGPLDMRFDRDQGMTLREMLELVDDRELADIIYKYGEERESRRIARAIKAALAEDRIGSTVDLAAVVARAARRWPRGIHPATRTFQALRIWVNGELDGLSSALKAWSRGLAQGGRLIVISFHSLEDRAAKVALRELVSEGFLLLTKKPWTADVDEVRSNPRARSAKLRAVARPLEAAGGAS